MTVNLQHKSVSTVYRNRTRPIQDCLSSQLLSLAFTSDTNDPVEEQFALAQQALDQRETALREGWDGSCETTPAASDYLSLCREITKSHLAARKIRFGEAQCAPFEELSADVATERDIFLIIKFMDEEQHIRSTIDCLLSQKGLDLNRVVLVGVDNMSSDRSGDIFQELKAANTTPVRMIYCQQPTSGGGSAARIGVDRCIASICSACERSGDWSLLHRAHIAVSDGDTVYHPNLVTESTAVFDTHHDIDGVMPFLTYKLTACLRLFDGYRQKNADELLEGVRSWSDRFVQSEIALDTILAQTALPRRMRKASQDGMTLHSNEGTEIRVPFIGRTEDNVRFGVLVDADGDHALVFEDRFLVVEKAPVSGYDNALVHLENGNVKSGEIWRWHSLIGHDLFLLQAFRSLDAAREFILPDTSDALKGFRAWAFAVGGQHQLSRPETARVTGTDYQSGRVLQSFGARSVLGSVFAHSETEIDRLTKMIRNFANKQSVFYGNTRSEALERASGLYLHMSRIQNQVEGEVRTYSEAFYRDVVFPERVLFPLRWMLQNFISALAVAPVTLRTQISATTLEQIFPQEVWKNIRAEHLSDEVLDNLNAMPFERLRAQGETLAETLISIHWNCMVAFYIRTLREFFAAESIPEDTYDYLLEPLVACRNSLLEERPMVDVNVVWSGREFVIDEARGQVLDVKTQNEDATL